MSEMSIAKIQSEITVSLLEASKGNLLYSPLEYIEIKCPQATLLSHSDEIKKFSNIAIRVAEILNNYIDYYNTEKLRADLVKKINFYLPEHFGSDVFDCVCDLRNNPPSLIDVGDLSFCLHIKSETFFAFIDFTMSEKIQCTINLSPKSLGSLLKS